MAVPTARTTRKARLTAALALAGMSQADFREKHLKGISTMHMNEVLRGNRDGEGSQWINERVDAFVARYLPSTPES
jgi:hypothetical protein